MKSALGIYQHCIDNLFAREPHVVSYLDDILITGSSNAEHLDNLDRVLKKLSCSGLQGRLYKCKFMAPSVLYQDHRIYSEVLHLTEDKIRAIRDAPALRNVTELRALLGLFQFYYRYVPNITDKLRPLYRLLWEDVFWRWETDHFLRFNKRKSHYRWIVSRSTMIQRNNLSSLVMLVSTVVGAVLSIIMPNCSEKPVANVSLTLFKKKITAS